MKKTISLPAILLGLLAASNVFAGQLTASGTVTPVQCTKLSSDVTATVSKNVQVGYACGGSAIYVGACSTAGQTKTRGLPCAVLSNANGGTPTVFTGTCTSATGTYNVTGPTMYLGNSSGGQVSGVPLSDAGGGTCTAAAVETRVTALP
jgi:hypothetical protein